MLELMRHSQYTANPLNPPYQGDFEDFAPVEIIGKCILISRVYYNPHFALCFQLMIPISSGKSNYTALELFWRYGFMDLQHYA